MIRMLLPVALALAGTGVGVGAAILFAPEAGGQSTAGPAAAPTPPDPAGPTPSSDDGPSDYVGLNNQFVVPLLDGERIGAMVVLSLSVEVGAGNAEAVYAREPKLRDGFLQVLFDHANRGGFDGEFTNANSMDVLRRLLSEVAQDLLGPLAKSVLITEIARQET